MLPQQNGRVAPAWSDSHNAPPFLPNFSRQIIEALRSALTADPHVDEADLARRAYDNLQYDFPVRAREGIAINIECL